MPLMGSGAYGPERVPISTDLPDLPRAIPYIPDPDPLPGQHAIPHCIAPEDLAGDPQWFVERVADQAAAAAAEMISEAFPGATPAEVNAAAGEAAEAALAHPLGWWVDIREGLNYELDEQGDAARHIGCTVDPRPFPVATGRATGVTLEAFLIAVAKHRNACHGGQSE